MFAASLRQERVEGVVIADHWRRVRDQDHQSWHRRAEETDKITGQSTPLHSLSCFHHHKKKKKTRSANSRRSQLWDTAGTERFRSVSRSYYRGAAGAILIYDLTSSSSFNNLQPFLNDARALASPNLTLVLAGNKLDLADSNHLVDTSMPPPTPSSYGSTSTITLAAPQGSGGYSMGSVSSTTSRSTVTTSTAADYYGGGGGTSQRATIAPDGREVTAGEASRWASSVNVPVTMEVSAFTGDGVDEVFARLARMILTKIELGEIDPDDPMSGIQYGDAGGLWHSGASDGASIKSTLTTEEMGPRRTGGRGRGKSRSQWGVGGMREWEEVFTLSNRRSRRGCC